MIRISPSMAMHLLLESDPSLLAAPPIPLDVVARFLTGCECFGLVNNGELVGFVAYEKNGSIHFHMTKNGALSRKLIRMTVQYGLDRYGIVRGEIACDNTRMLRVARFIGASEMSNDKTVLFRLEGKSWA